MGCGSIAPPFLLSALDGGKWAASRNALFTPGQRVPGAHCIGGWAGKRTVWTLWRKVKSLASAGNRTPAVQLLAHRYNDSAGFRQNRNVNTTT
jgi:hypothetical protein